MLRTTCVRYASSSTEPPGAESSLSRRVRARKKPTTAAVAAAEVATAEAAVASALGEVQKARLVASRLERAAAERNKECADAESALEEQ